MTIQKMIEFLKHIAETYKDYTLSVHFDCPECGKSFTPDHTKIAVHFKKRT